MRKHHMLIAALTLLAAATIHPSRSIAQAPGETCATAPNITSFPFTNTSFNGGYSDSGDLEPTCGGTNDGKGAWYRFTAPNAGQYMFATAGSDHDTVIALYTGSCGFLTEVGCDDDSGESNTSMEILNMNGGESVYLLLTAFGSGSGGTLVTTIDHPHESVLMPRGNLTATIPAGQVSVTKKIAVKVRNADVGETAGHAIGMYASDNSDCNLTLSTPDFDSRTLGTQNPVTVGGGKTKTATFTATFNAADINTTSKSNPMRCPVYVELQNHSPGDQSYENNWMNINVDVIDKNDLP